MEMSFGTRGVYLGGNSGGPFGVVVPARCIIRYGGPWRLMSGTAGPTLLVLVGTGGRTGVRGRGGGGIPEGGCSGWSGGRLVRERERAFPAMAYSE